MISVILTATGDAKALARLMGALVPAAAEGLVRDVAVLGAAGRSADIADDAGADLYAADAFAEATRRARGPWLAGLPIAAQFAPDWLAMLAAHLALAPAAPARLVASGWRPGGAEGWLVPKALVPSAAAAEQDLHRLARGSGAVRLRILRRR